MTASVGIVVVNWNAGAQLDACLGSIAKHGDGLVVQTVVVDNASDDGSELYARRPGVTLIASSRNLGFAAACNLGARALDAPYLLLLNPDAQLLPGTLSALLMAMRADPQIGVCGIRLVGDDGRTQRHVARAPSNAGFLAEATGLARLAPRRFPGLLDPAFDHERSGPAAHVIGALYLVRRGLWDALGGLDERFFLYLEDLDFSTRTRAAGFRVEYTAAASAYHRGGGTSSHAKAWRLRHALLSRLRFAAKHFGPRQAAAIAAATLAVEPLIRIARGGLRGSTTEVRNTVAAYRAVYGELWRSFTSRRRRQCLAPPAAAASEVARSDQAGVEESRRS